MQGALRTGPQLALANEDRKRKRNAAVGHRSVLPGPEAQAQRGSWSPQRFACG